MERSGLDGSGTAGAAAAERSRGLRCEEVCSRWRDAWGRREGSQGARRAAQLPARDTKQSERAGSVILARLR